jgi:hypothetical protein
MWTNGSLDSDASGNMVDQKMYRSIWCLVYACVLDFKPHQEKVT